jgi:DNA-binding PadR family transcriptional regulator
MPDKRPLDRMRRKIVVENLWFVILKMLSKSPRYGHEIRKIVRDSFGLILGNITAYKVLYSLEAGGYVKRERNSYRSRYSLTAKGKAELKDARAFLKEAAA